MAGSIKWSRSLFARVKQTMAKLYTVEAEMMALELGQEVHRKYLTLARQALTFEKALFKQWLTGIDAAALSYLKLNILTRAPEGQQRIAVNFSEGLVQLMRETRYLDRMGFDIPEIALNITLQEESYTTCAAAVGACDACTCCASSRALAGLMQFVTGPIQACTTSSATNSCTRMY